jgi:hypothetical protein
MRVWILWFPPKQHEWGGDGFKQSLGPAPQKLWGQAFILLGQAEVALAGRIGRVGCSGSVSAPSHVI